MVAGTACCPQGSGRSGAGPAEAGALSLVPAAMGTGACVLASVSGFHTRRTVDSCNLCCWHG